MLTFANKIFIPCLRVVDIALFNALVLLNSFLCVLTDSVTCFFITFNMLFNKGYRLHPFVYFWG